MHDILKETPIYEFMVKEAREEALKQGLQQGLEQGLEQALEQTMQFMRDSVFEAIVEKFPDIPVEAWKRLREVKDMATLRRILVKVTVAQSKEEVLQALPQRDEKEAN